MNEQATEPLLPSGVKRMSAPLLLLALLLLQSRCAQAAGECGAPLSLQDDAV
jgi:hypothetical protein